MEPKTLYQFIKRCRNFSKTNGFTSDLKVDKSNTVESLSEVFGTSVGGIIADIDNGVGELLTQAIIYYESAGNTKMADKFRELEN